MTLRELCLALLDNLCFVFMLLWGEAVKKQRAEILLGSDLRKIKEDVMLKKSSFEGQLVGS